MLGQLAQLKLVADTRHAATVGRLHRGAMSRVGRSEPGVVEHLAQLGPCHRLLLHRQRWGARVGPRQQVGGEVVEGGPERATARIAQPQPVGQGVQHRNLVNLHIGRLSLRRPVRLLERIEQRRPELMLALLQVRLALLALRERQVGGQRGKPVATQQIVHLGELGDTPHEVVGKEQRQPERRVGSPVKELDTGHVAAPAVSWRVERIVHDNAPRIVA